MLRYMAGRLIGTIPVLFLISLLTFLMIHLTPGDPVRLMLGDDASKEAIDALNRKLGLDQSLPVQYLRWLGNLLTGDMGQSIRTRQPVLEAVVSRLPVTLELSFLSMIIAVALGLPTGIIAAVRRNSAADVASTTLALTGISIPNFFLGIVFILIFSEWLGWLPPSGYVPFFDDPVENLKLMIMPSIALGTALAGTISRMMRSSLLEVLGADFVRTARAKGLSERSAILSHAVKNALLPVVTIIGLQTGTVLGGAILTETIFALPGIGRLVVDSIFARDFPIVQGVILFLALTRILTSFLTDMFYARLDPRISYS
jgi:peptide/nickel transport system permease protein